MFAGAPHLAIIEVREPFTTMNDNEVKSPLLPWRPSPSPRRGEGWGEGVIQTNGGLP